MGVLKTAQRPRPQYLCAVGRYAEAEAVLARVARWNGKPAPKLQYGGPDEPAAQPAGGLKASAKARAAERGSAAGRLLRGALLWRHALPLAFVWFAAAFGYYGVVLIQVMKYTTRTAHFEALIVRYGL